MNLSPSTGSGAGSRLSAETLHASTVATEGRAVLISGPSGAGKSDLALRLLDRGFTLVSDALLVELTSEIQRLPDDSRERPLLGVRIPLISIDAMTASAPSKVALALDRMGLKF